MDKNQGYEIQKAVLFDNGRGMAFGEHPREGFVTWQFTDEAGKRDYYWGHYHSDKATAEKEFDDRGADYMRRFAVKVVQTEAPGLYKYYSTQRPVDIGTFPKPPHNAPDEIVNYDQRVPVENETRLAWGHLTYTKPLADKEMQDYELRPSRDNPDLRRIMEEQTQTAGQWEETRHIPDQKRLTWFYPDFGCYVLKEYVSPEKLAAAAESVEVSIAAKRQRGRVKPAPISEQMKEGQKLAQEHRGRAAPGRDAPDKDDR